MSIHIKKESLLCTGKAFAYGKGKLCWFYRKLLKNVIYIGTNSAFNNHGTCQSA